MQGLVLFDGLMPSLLSAAVGSIPLLFEHAVLHAEGKL